MIGKEGSKHELTCCIFLYYSKKNCSRAFLSYMVWQEHLAEITTDISIFPRSRQQLFQNCICHRQTHLQKLLQLGKCFLLVFSMSNSTPTVYFSSNRFLSRIQAYILTVQYYMHMHSSFFNPQPIMLRKQMQKTNKIKQIQFL